MLTRIDVAAADRFMAAAVRWYVDRSEMHCTTLLTCTRFTDPLRDGDYPRLLKEMRGDILPTFTAQEKALIKGSTDFIAYVLINAEPDVQDQPLHYLHDPRSRPVHCGPQEPVGHVPPRRRAELQG